MTREKRVVLIGAGNLAHHLAPALLKAGVNLCQLYSRTPEAAGELGKRTGISCTADTVAVYPDCDIYIFCVSDDALATVLKSIRINRKALFLHTSGSRPMDVFRPFATRYGVLYPLQTFSKGRVLDFREIPLCIEGVSRPVTEEIREFAGLLSGRVEEVSSEKRKRLHLAAVFANNFVNRLYGIAGGMLAAEGLDFAMLRPLIFETAHKVMQMPPEAAQTGPARRGDEGILEMHRALLKNDRKLLNLYVAMSESIRESAESLRQAGTL